MPRQGAIPGRTFSGVNKPMTPVKSFAAGGSLGGYYGNSITDNPGLGLDTPQLPWTTGDTAPAGPDPFTNPTPSGSGSTTPPANPTGFQTYGNGPGKATSSNTAGGVTPAVGSGGSGNYTYNGTNWVNSSGGQAPAAPAGDGFAFGGGGGQAPLGAGNYGLGGDYGGDSGGGALAVKRGGAIPGLDLGGDPGDDGSDDGNISAGPGGVDVNSILGFGRQSMGLPADLGLGDGQQTAGLFDPIRKALQNQPVEGGNTPPAPAQGGTSGPQGQGPSQSDVDAQWHKDNDPAPSTGGQPPPPAVPGQANGGTVKSFEHGGDTTNPAGTAITPPGSNVVSFDDGGDVAGGDMGNPAAAGQPTPPTAQPAAPQGQGVLPSANGAPGAMQQQVQQSQGLSQYISGVGAMPADQAQALLSSHNGDMEAALASLGSNKQAQFALMQYGRQQYNGLNSMARAAMQEGSPESQDKAAQALTQAHQMVPRSKGGGKQFSSNGSGGFTASTHAGGSVNSIVAKANKMGMSAAKTKPPKAKKQHGYDQGGGVIPGPDDAGLDDDVTGTVTPDQTQGGDDTGGTQITGPQAQLYTAALPYDHVMAHGIDDVLAAAGRAAGGTDDGDITGSIKQGGGQPPPAPQAAIPPAQEQNFTPTPGGPGQPGQQGVLDKLFDTVKKSLGNAVDNYARPFESPEAFTQHRMQDQNDQTIDKMGISPTQKDLLKSGRATPTERSADIRNQSQAQAEAGLAPEAKEAMDAHPGETVRLQNGDEWVKNPATGKYEQAGREEIDPRITEHAKALYGQDTNSRRYDAYIASHDQGQQDAQARSTQSRQAQADKLALANANNTSKQNVAGQTNATRTAIAAGNQAGQNARTGQNNQAKQQREGAALQNRSGIAGQNNQTRRDIADQTDSRGRDIADETNARARDIADQNNTRARDINNQNNATKQEGQQQGSFNSIFKTLATMSENTGKGMSPGDLMKTTTQVLQARRQYMQQNPDATEAPGDIQVHNGHTYMFGADNQWHRAGQQ